MPFPVSARGPSYALEKELTILRIDPSPAPGPDPRTLGLAALGWVLADDARAHRLLALTGLTPDALRTGLEDDSVLGAVLDFLAAHEPDLLAAAQGLDVAPETLVTAAGRLGG